jgi:hypothetical protein
MGTLNGKNEWRDFGEVRFTSQEIFCNGRIIWGEQNTGRKNGDLRSLFFRFFS